MISNDVLKRALSSVYNEAVNALEGELASGAPHRFSDSFEIKAKQLFKVATKKYVHVFHRPMRLAVAVCLAIIMIISGAIMTLAMVRPEVRTFIKEQWDSFRYRFVQEETGDKQDKFEYIQPKTPDSFKAINKEKGTGYYYVSYKDDKGHFIDYGQYEPEEYTINITNTANKERIEIKGRKADLYEEDGCYNLIWSNDYYVFTIYSDYPKEKLIKIAESIK